MVARTDLLLHRSCPVITSGNSWESYLTSSYKVNDEDKFLVRESHEVKPDLREIAAKHRGLFEDRAKE